MDGSCLCEGVKFTVDGEPENVFVCYCTHCSKNAGGPGQISAKLKRELVHLRQGEELIRTWILDDNLSGFEKQKLFCGQCGCTLWTIPMRHGGTHLIVRTSLIKDGLKLLPPKMEFFAARKVALSGPELKSFDRMPGF